MGIGSYQAGYFFDVTGDYTLSYGTAAIAGVINLSIVASLGWFRLNRTGALRVGHHLAQAS